MKYTILYIDNSYTFGGAIRSLETTINAMNNERNNPILITAQNSSYLKEHFSNINWYSLDMKLPWVHDDYYKIIKRKWIVKRFRFVHKLVAIFRSLYWLIIYTIPESWRIYRIGRIHKANIIHLNNILGSQLSGIIASKMLRIPCVAHLRDYEKKSLSTRYYAKLINHHIAISESIKSNIIELGVPESKITVIHDAVDIAYFDDVEDLAYLKNEFSVKENELLIGLFGRIIPWKGTKEFILAMERLSSYLTEFRAFVIGDSSDSSEIYCSQVKELTTQLGLDEKIIFTGYRSDVAELMKMMDVIVHASITPEPFGMVIIEAMASGKPVVASNIGGGPLEIVDDHVCGFLVDPRNPEDVSAVLYKLLCNPYLRQSFGLAGRQRVVSRYESSLQASKIEHIYDNLLKNR